MNESTDKLRYIDNNEYSEPSGLVAKFVRLMYFKNIQSSLDNVINGLANMKNIT